MSKNENKLQFIPRKRNYMDRIIDATDTRQRFLIVCEGAKTEPQYFERFRVPGLVVKVEGVGMNTLSLVEEAVKLREEDDYDQVWCVFDKDDFSIDQFENAIHCAKENGMYVAYSNQAFELWYVLHFEYLHSEFHFLIYGKYTLCPAVLAHRYPAHKSSSELLAAICPMELSRV